MPMKVEAAVVTQRQTVAEFNTDSININGKTFPREIVRNGYKGSGVVSGDVYFSLASSKVEGFADATVVAFNERAKKFPVTRDPKNVFSGFYEDCRSALLNMDRQEDELVSACLYASGRTVTVAGNGDTGLFALRFSKCGRITVEKAENTVADYNVAVISDVSENDIFMLLSPGAVQVLTTKDIEDICKVADGSVKRIVSLISKVALNNGAMSGVSVIAVKVLETAAESELASVGFMPDFEAMEKLLYGENTEEKTEEAQTVNEAEGSSASEAVADEACEDVSASNESVETAEEAELAEMVEAVDVVDADEQIEVAAAEDTTEEVVEKSAETVENADESEALMAEETDNDEEAADAAVQNAKSDKKTRIVLFTILGIMFTVSVVLIGLIVAELFADKLPVTENTTLEETTVEENTTEEETTEEETTEEEAATEGDDQTDAATNAAAATTQAAVTTTRSQQTTRAPAAETTAAAQTTEAAVTEEATTAEAVVNEQDTTSAPNSDETTTQTQTADESADV